MSETTLVILVFVAVWVVAAAVGWFLGRWIIRRSGL